MSQDSEILDLVDENGKVIGQATRAECHNNHELIHQVVHCWVLNDKHQILWQQRSFKKESSPGHWDMSCGGHVRAGEKPDNVVKRELEEELGLVDVDVKFVERYLRTSPDGRQTEMIYLYYAVVNKKESEFRLRDGEVERVKWFDVKDATMKYLNKEVQATDFIVSQLPKVLEFIVKRNYSKKSNN